MLLLPIEAMVVFVVMELHCEQLAVDVHVAGGVPVQLKHVSVSAERQ